MAKSTLFIGWGAPVTGREAVSLKVFQEAQEYYAGLQRKGDIDSMEPFLLEEHGGDLHGFFLIRGEQGKLDALRSREDFVRLTAKADLVVQNIGIVTAYTGEALGRRMDAYRAAVSEVVQPV